MRDDMEFLEHDIGRNAFFHFYTSLFQHFSFNFFFWRMDDGRKADTLENGTLLLFRVAAVLGSKVAGYSGGGGV